MSRWRKLLARMLCDTNPRNYTYDDAAAVLAALGFTPAKGKPKVSHRIWRFERTESNVTGAWIVGLVDAGHGTLKPGYIRDMIVTLRDAGLILDEGQADVELDD